jgi:hypothetical protein
MANLGSAAASMGATCMYVEARSRFLDGDTILFRGKSAISRIIEWVTDSPYSHAGLVFWWDDRLMVLEASSHGVAALPLSGKVAAYDGKCEWWRCTFENLNRAKMKVAARSELGKDYAYWGLIRAIRRFVASIKGTSDPWKPPDKFQCTQYWSYVHRVGGFDVQTTVPDVFTAPLDIAKSPQMQKLALLTATSVPLLTAGPT